MKHIKANVYKHFTLDERIHKAWVDLDLAVQNLDLKMAVKYAMYLNYLHKKKNDPALLPVIEH